MGALRGRVALILTAALVGSCASNDPPRPGTPLTIWVFEERITLDEADTPIGGARVAFDPPGGGERVEKLTEPDGHVTFEADFARGGASVTVLADDHVYVTMLEASPETARARPNALGKPASDLVVFPARADRLVEEKTVELRGYLFGKRGTNDLVSLAASALSRHGAAQSSETSYVLRAPKDRPFFVLGHETRTVVDANGNVTVENELLKSFRVELPARGDDELLDLDLPKLPALPTRLIHVRAEAPQGPSSPFGAGTRAVASVESADSGIVLGPHANTKWSADGRVFDIDVNVVDTEVAPERIFSRAVLSSPDGSESVRLEPGTMADGMVWKDFPLPPSLAGHEAPRTVRDPIPLDGFPTGAELVAKIYANGSLLWIVYGPPGGPREKSFTIPYRNEVTNGLVNVFALSISARSGRIELAPRGELYRYQSTFRDILLRRQ